MSNINMLNFNFVKFPNYNIVINNKTLLKIILILKLLNLYI